MDEVYTNPRVGKKDEKIPEEEVKEEEQIGE